MDFKKTFRIIWNIIKIALLIFVFVMIDKSCSHRDIDRMPMISSELISGQYQAYSPASIVAAWKHNDAMGDSLMSIKAQGDSTTVIDRMDCGKQAFYEAATHEKRSISISLALVFILFVLFIMGIRSLTRKRKKIEDGTSERKSITIKN